MTHSQLIQSMRLGILSFLLFAAHPQVWAGEGHDHGDAVAAPNLNGPQRLPDGSVFLPKPAQRQLQVRTIRAETSQLPRSVELNAKVVMDPNAGGRVQAMSAGRIEAGAKGLPNVGQAVRKGDVLAYVVSSMGPVEKSNQIAQLAELKASKSLVEKRLIRLQALSDTVPRKDIEAAESELQSFAGRLAAIEAGLNSKEMLIAPVSGVIASAHAVAGQVIDARELVFEIIDPARMRVEALAFDATLITQTQAAFMDVNGARVTLKFVGGARSLRDQAIPLIFTAQGQELSNLPLGSQVRVVLQTKASVKGISLPLSALMKSAANQSIVWIKTEPERFQPRTITFEPLNATQVAVTSGLENGDLVATQGATLINQVR